MPLTNAQKRLKLALLRKKHSGGVITTDKADAADTTTSPLSDIPSLAPTEGDFAPQPASTAVADIDLPADIAPAFLRARTSDFGSDLGNLLVGGFTGLTGVQPDPASLSPFNKFARKLEREDSESTRFAGELGGLLLSLLLFKRAGAALGASNATKGGFFLRAEKALQNILPKKQISKKALDVGKFVLKRATEGGAIGGGLEARRQIVNPNVKFDPAEIGISAAEFAAIDAGLGILGKTVGTKIRGLIEKRKFTQAKKLFDETVAKQGKSKIDEDIRKQVDNFLNRGQKLLAEPKGRGEGFTFRDVSIKDKLQDVSVEQTRKELLGTPIRRDRLGVPIKPRAQRDVFGVESTVAEGKPVKVKAKSKRIVGAQKTLLDIGKPSPLKKTFEDIETTTNATGSLRHNLDALKNGADDIQKATDGIPVKRDPSGDVTLGFLGINPTDMARLGRAVTDNIELVAGKITPQSFKQIKNRMTSPAGKELADAMRLAQEDQHLLAGDFLTRIETDKAHRLFKMSKDEAIKFADEIEAGRGGIVTEINKEIFKELRGSGIEVGEIKNYFRRQLKKDVAEDLFSGLEKLSKRLGGLKEPSEKEIIDALSAVGGKTAKILDAMVDTGRAKSYQDATQRLYETVGQQLFPGTGFLKKRSLDFTGLEDLLGEIYERDARVVVTKYINDASKVIGIARNLGGVRVESGRFIIDGRAQSLLNAIQSTEEKRVAETALQMFTGQYDRLHAYNSKAARKFVDGFVGAEFVTKIAGGTATLANTTQTAISTYLNLGGLKTLAGIGKSFTKSGRLFGKRSGIYNQNLLHASMGYQTGGTIDKFVDISSKLSGFTGINKINIMVAANAAESAIQSFYKTANGSGFLARISKLNINRARTRLADFGIDYTKPLTEDIILKKMFRFAQDSQLQKNILNDPLWINTKAGKFFGLFYRFGVKQAMLAKDIIWREIKRGNPLPMLRLVAGGYVGGEGIVFAKNKIKEFLSGEPHFRDEEFVSWERLVNNVAAVGALGMLSDITSSLFEDDETALTRTGKFIATPVVISDAMLVLDTYFKTIEDIRKFDAKTAFRRNIPKAGRLLGSLTGNLSRRALTKAQKERAQSTRKGRFRTRILDAFIEQDGDKARKLLKSWNENHPNDMLTVDDIGPDAVIVRMTNEARRQAEARE